MTERLALIYSDGSIGVLSEGTTVGKASEERAFCDHNETRADKLTKIARVTVEVLEMIEEPAAPAPAAAAACPHCGRERT